MTFLLLRYDASFGNGTLLSFGNAAGLPKVPHDCSCCCHCCCYCCCCCCFLCIPKLQGESDINTRLLLPFFHLRSHTQPWSHPGCLPYFPMCLLLALFLFCVTTYDKPCHQRSPHVRLFPPPLNVLQSIQSGTSAWICNKLITLDIYFIIIYF